MTKASAIHDQLRETADGIEAARGLVEAGHVIDLAGLETRVDAICSRVRTVAAVERQALKQTLIAVIDGLNALAAALTAQRDEVGRTMQDVSTRQRAVSAYGGGRKPGTKPKKNKP